MRTTGWLLLLAGAGLVSCELAEVTAPASSDVLVIEAVLRAGSREQYAILHRSIEGAVVRGVPGASVAVIAEDGTRIKYEEGDIRSCLLSQPEDWELDEIELEASCYVAPRSAGRFVQPGHAYELHVETPDGRIGRGRTRLPSAFEYRVPDIVLDPATLTLACTLPNTPFTMVWGSADGAWSYVVALQLAGLSEVLSIPDIDVADPLELSSVSVSAADTTIIFPANIGLFQRADVDHRIFAALVNGIPPGIETTLVVLAADRNYTNAIRGGRFNPSGNVRLSSVTGDAVGVFGGVVPIVIRSVAQADGMPPPCAMPPI